MRDTVASYWCSARIFTGLNETVIPPEPPSFYSARFGGDTVSQRQTNVDQAAGAFHLSIHDALTGSTNGTSAGLAAFAVDKPSRRGQAIAADELRTVLSYALGTGRVAHT